jgi:aldehyde:ferredoxin oxidoreductase
MFHFEEKRSMKIRDHYRGYAGGFLRIDVTARWANLDTQYFQYDTVRQFMGGKGLGSYVLYKELKPGVDPLGADNKVILLTGPMTGSGVVTGSRLCLVAKGPATGFWLDTGAGGFFGPHLKKNGYDGIILEGRADKPVYVYIHENDVQVLNADRVWNLTIPETNRVLKEIHGQGVHIAAIGPPGERQAKISSVIIDGRAAGRGGMGSVLGSKNIKALVLQKGSGTVRIYDPESMKLINKEVRDLLLTGPTKRMGIYGSSGSIAPINEAHAWSVKNFQEGKLEGVEQIYPEMFKRQIWKKHRACFACPIACTQVGKISEGKWSETESEGLEYQTIWAFGPQCGVSEINAIVRADYLCDVYGMDTISLGNTIGFLMECFERGLLTLSDTGGIELRFGSGDAVVAAVEKAGKGEGYLGQLAVNGVREAAKEIGQGSEKFAIHVKGLEVSSYDPRRAHGMALCYARADRGACHVRPATHGMEILGRPKAIDPFTTEGKPEMVKRGTEMGNILWDSSGLCKFAAWALSPQKALELMNAVTGFQIDGMNEFSRMGERVNNLIRSFNVREGMTAEDDTLPDRLLNEPQREGPAAGIVLKEHFMEMKKKYYQICGWDENGVPTEAKLRELGLYDLVRGAE